jgi:hypothetical protein
MISYGQITAVLVIGMLAAPSLLLGESAGVFSAEVQSGSPPTITIHSKEHVDNMLTAEVSGFIDIPFSQLSDALIIPENWCEIVPLTPNVKACTTAYEKETAFLTFYLGRKIYQSPIDSHPIEYLFRVEETNDLVFRVILSAGDGPLGTSDYRIELEGEKSGGGTNLSFRSSYRESIRSRLVTEGYLKTAGRKKVGFSEVGRQKNGDVIYVNGIQGALERNAVRYYLALKAYLETARFDPDSRFEERIRHWFDLTENHHLQLFEMDREEYLQAKRRERRNQILLQERPDNG